MMKKINSTSIFYKCRVKSRFQVHHLNFIAHNIEVHPREVFIEVVAVETFRRKVLTLIKTFRWLDEKDLPPEMFLINIKNSSTCSAFDEGRYQPREQLFEPITSLLWYFSLQFLSEAPLACQYLVEKCYLNCHSHGLVQQQRETIKNPCFYSL